MVPGMTGDQLVGVLAIAFAVVMLLGLMDRSPRSGPPPNADDAAITARLLAWHAEVTMRRCYCPEGRWARWKDGVEAGPDHVVGTADDITVDEPEKPA